MRVFAKDLCLYQASAIDLNLKYLWAKQRNQNTISAQENIIHKFENDQLYIIIQ